MPVCGLSLLSLLRVSLMNNKFLILIKLRVSYSSLMGNVLFDVPGLKSSSLWRKSVTLFLVSFNILCTKKRQSCVFWPPDRFMLCLEPCISHGSLNLPAVLFSTALPTKRQTECSVHTGLSSALCLLPGWCICPPFSQVCTVNFCSFNKMLLSGKPNLPPIPSFSIWVYLFMYQKCTLSLSIKKKELRFSLRIHWKYRSVLGEWISLPYWIYSA